MRYGETALAISIVLLLLTGAPSIYSQHYDQYALDEHNVSGYVEIFITDPENIDVYLYINYSSQPPAILLELPMEPATESLDIVSGDALLAMYVGGGYALILINASSGSAIISYKALADILDGGVIADIRSPQWASYTEIYLRRELIINTASTSSINFSGEVYEEVGSYLVYKLSPNASIEIPLYGEHGGGVDYKIIVITAGIILAAVSAAIVGRFSKRSYLEELDAIDKEILSIIRSLGGEATMSRIMDRTGIPRTTLWRRVKKLNRLGYVEILRIGRSSLIRVRKARRAG